VTGSGYLEQVFTASPGQGNHYWGVGPIHDGLNSWLSVTPAFYGNISVYLGPKAKAGVLTIPNTISMEIVDGSQMNMIEAGTTIEIKKIEMVCTVLAPPTIDFGTVNLWNFAGNTTGSPGGARKDVLSVVDGNLSISCEGDSPDMTATAKLTLIGKIPVGGVNNDLDVTMDNSGNPAPATIRASIKDIQPPCPSNEGTKFSGSGSKIDINPLRIGQNNIPYRFSLCSRPAAGINQFGSASAQATITVDWD